MTRALENFIAEWRRERPDLNLSAFSIAAAIKQIDQQTEAEFRRVSAGLGIGPGDLRVLFALRRSGVDNPRRPTDLFQSLLVTSGAITKQLDRHCHIDCFYLAVTFWWRSISIKSMG